MVGRALFDRLSATKIVQYLRCFNISMGGNGQVVNSWIEGALGWSLCLVWNTDIGGDGVCGFEFEFGRMGRGLYDSR